MELENHGRGLGGSTGLAGDCRDGDRDHRPDHVDSLPDRTLGDIQEIREAGWKSLIPYYSQWVEYGYTWNPKIILWNVTAAIVDYIGDVSIIALKKGLILTVAMIAIIVFWICRFAVSAIAAHKLARAFAHGMGYTIGLLLLPGLFQFILGCGSSRYNGPEGRWSKEQE